MNAQQVSTWVIGMLVLISCSHLIRAEEPAIERFTLSCTLHFKGNGVINGVFTPELPAQPDQSWTASFEIQGRHGRYYDFESGEWSNLVAVDTDKFVLTRPLETYNSPTTEINRSTGEYRRSLIFNFPNGNEGIQIWAGPCEKIPWKQPSAAKF